MQVWAAQQFHRDKRETPKFANLIRGHNIRMRQSANKMHLAPKPITDAHVMQNLYRSWFTILVHRSVDVSLATAAKRFLNDESANLRSRIQR
jgi:hypothetical protein